MKDKYGHPSSSITNHKKRWTSEFADNRFLTTDAFSFTQSITCLDTINIM